MKAGSTGSDLGRGREAAISAGVLPGAASPLPSRFCCSSGPPVCNKHDACLSEARQPSGIRGLEWPRLAAGPILPEWSWAAAVLRKLRRTRRRAFTAPGIPGAGGRGEHAYAGRARVMSGIAALAEWLRFRGQAQRGANPPQPRAANVSMCSRATHSAGRVVQRGTWFVQQASQAFVLTDCLHCAQASQCVHAGALVWSLSTGCVIRGDFTRSCAPEAGLKRLVAEFGRVLRPGARFNRFPNVPPDRAGQCALIMQPDCAPIRTRQFRPEPMRRQPAAFMLVALQVIGGMSRQKARRKGEIHYTR